MAKTVTKYTKNKIYHPKYSGSEFCNNIITDNITKEDGNVINRRSDNAGFASKWVSEHQM